MYNIISAEPVIPVIVAAWFGLVLFCHKKECTGKTLVQTYSPIANTCRHTKETRSKQHQHKTPECLNKCHFTCTKWLNGFNLVWCLQCCRFAVCLVLSVLSHLWLVSLWTGYSPMLIRDRNSWRRGVRWLCLTADITNSTPWTSWRPRKAPCSTTRR